jgi:lipoprotein-releasing system permease protein
MSFGAFVRMVAFRYLRPRRQEGFVSLIALFSFLGIALGVAALIVTMSVMNGFAADLLGRIIGLGGDITITSPQGRIADFATLAGRLRGLPGVTAIRPVVEGQVLASGRSGASGAEVRGLGESDLEALHLFPSGGAPLADDAVVVGGKVAAALGLRPGDRITLTMPDIEADQVSVARARSFTVAGIAALDVREENGGYIFMPLAAAQDYFAMPGAVTGLELFVKDPDRVRDDEGALRAALGPGLVLADWQQSNAALFDALRVERAVMFVILSLIVLVAAFNIVCSMIMLVRDKGRDIAILRTMGATRGMVLRIFMLSGAAIGVVGTLAGFGLGVACAENIKGIQHWTELLLGRGMVSAGLDFFSQVPARVDPVEVGLVVLVALGLSLLATLYPSWRAARLDPVEALRYE